jgi:YVTN family beta-propeller protein
MKKLYVIIAIGFWLSAVSAQWLETVIYADGRWSGRMVYNSLHNKVYCANYDSTVIIVDGATNSVIREVKVGTRPLWMVYNWLNDRLYCALGGNTSDTVVVLDGQTDEVVGRVIVAGRSVNTLGFNPTNNKLYVGSNVTPNRVSIVDCDSDTVTAVLNIPGGNLTHEPMHVESTNKVYIPVHTSDYVMVLDGATDSIIKDDLRIGSGPLCAGVDYTRNRAFFAPWSSDSLVVVDGDSDRVIRRIRVGYRPLGWDYNRVNDRVYCTSLGDSNFVVLDAATYERLEQFVYSDRKNGVFWNPINNKVYVSSAYTNVLLVYDGASSRYIMSINLPAVMAGWTWNWTQNRLYVECSPGGAIAVVRDSGGYAVAERPPPGASRIAPGATVVRGVLRLEPASSHRPRATSWLLDINGRKVLDLQPGANDVSRLAPGVYFVCSGLSAVSRQPSAVQKVVVTR